MKTYEVAFCEKPGYLHATVTGRNSAENVKGYMEEIVQVCSSTGRKNVLIEERLTGPRVNMLEAFLIASEGSSRFRDAFDSIAYIDVNAEGHMMKFAETVATNRLLPVKVFSTVQDAEKWMTDNVR